jgi:surface protein
MKKLLLLIFGLFLSSQTIKAQVVLDANGVTIKWTGTTVPSPYFVQASPRGTLEWFAIVSDATKSNISDYAGYTQTGIAYFTRPGSSTPIPFNNIITSLVTDMSFMFSNNYYFNQDISSWDVSKVTEMQNMFGKAKAFNQPIGSWNVSKVTSMHSMFIYVDAFNQPIGSWDVSKVRDMSGMFGNAKAFNQPIGSWNVSNVIIMNSMFANATLFNQPIGSWNVSKVTSMDGMFFNDFAFNQPIGSWDVSKVTSMNAMFDGANTFNQPIGSWNVSNVINMNYMFSNTAFNQNIGSWNVSKVTSMNAMFDGANTFNQPIGSWNVSKVTSMNGMFRGANTFNQPIGSWDVSNVTDMTFMFDSANTFNQPIGSWNVSKVSYMDNMFSGNTSLSIANYDSLLIGWSTITSTETPLLQGVFFVGGNVKFCKGASARADIINTYGWIIKDGGLDCSTSVEELESSKVKLYPNPVISELNVNVDYHLIDEPYVIIDGLGRIVLGGKFKEVESTINLKELAKGIYYLKLSNSYSSKFIKE